MARLAIVTGTSRGIGLATAAALLERGWSVLGVARSAAPKELRRDGYEHARLDLSDLAATGAWLEGEYAPRGALGDAERVGLVNNAALLQPVAAVHRLEPEALARAACANLAAPIWLAGFVLRHAPRAPVRIVELSSGAASSPYAGWSAYCATKAGLDMAARVLARELEEVDDLRGRDVAVVSYAPGVVATQMQAELRAADARDFPRRQRFVELHEGGELVDPARPAAEIADLLEADGLPPLSERRFQG